MIKAYIDINKLEDIIKFIKEVQLDYEKVINRDEPLYKKDFEQFREDLEEILSSLNKFKNSIHWLMIYF